MDIKEFLELEVVQSDNDSIRIGGNKLVLKFFLSELIKVIPFLVNPPGGGERELHTMIDDFDRCYIRVFYSNLRSIPLVEIYTDYVSQGTRRYIFYINKVEDIEDVVNVLKPKFIYFARS